MSETLHRFRSVYLGNERAVWIRQPLAASRPSHLAVFLDAERYRGQGRVDVLPVIEELEAAGLIGNTLFVFVSEESPEARWRECPCHPPFARFVNDELVPWLEALHPLIKQGGTSVLIGLSYTGLAAAFCAMRAEGKFNKVIAQSGSFWSDECWLTRQVEAQNQCLPVEFYLDVGSQETAENVQHKDDVLQVVSQIEGVNGFRDVLLALGHDVKYVEFEGGHDYASWRKTLPEALRWALSGRRGVGPTISSKTPPSP